jgi:hypothetical protein
MGGGRVSCRKEDGRHLCDIAVGKRDVGIELKHNLGKTTQIDRLIGQLSRFKEHYDDLVVVLVGHTDKDALENLKDSIERIQGRGFGFQEPRIKIINKGRKRKSTDTTKQSGTQKKKSGGRRSSGIMGYDLKIDLPEFKPPKFDF